MAQVTDRLRVRELTHDDLDALATLYADAQVMRFSLGVLTLEQSLERFMLQYEQQGWGMWLLEQRQERVFVGCCGLLPQVVDGRREVELAYRLMPGYWGRGLATEAARACCDRAFGEFALGRLISIIEPTHVASIGVAEKCGLAFEKESTMWNRRVRIYSRQGCGASASLECPLDPVETRS